MRLKVQPRDFRVREELVFPRVREGAYYVHVLRKEKLDTQQALAAVAKLAKVSREDIAFAGLKDRQGRTEQWISIKGRRLDHRGRSLQVAFRGRTDRPVTSRMSTGNRFEIVVRDLERADVERLQRNADVVAASGLPNYFDDQRFGSVRHGQGFPMRDLLLGDFERALRRMVAQPSPVAITGDVKLKRALGRHWGDWQTCRDIARGPAYGRLFAHLIARPDDFRGALLELPVRQRLIHAFAYQSLLWNRAVHRLLRQRSGRDSVRIPTVVGGLVAWGAADERLRAWLDAQETPLFAPGAVGGSSEFAAMARETMAREGLDPDVGPEPVPGMALRPEPRRLVVAPRDLEVGEARADETARGREKVRLAFGLPRGSYATLVVKRLLAHAPRGAGGGDRGKRLAPQGGSGKRRPGPRRPRLES